MPEGLPTSVELPDHGELLRLKEQIAEVAAQELLTPTEVFQELEEGVLHELEPETTELEPTGHRQAEQPRPSEGAPDRNKRIRARVLGTGSPARVQHSPGKRSRRLRSGPRPRSK